ncbi:MAG: hypothetical protein LBE75_05090 [Burkholderiales bacterium]|jgi:hypothetical protein|nr:hypothetical protein [Burkholderiales bacterium]
MKLWKSLLLAVSLFGLAGCAHHIEYGGKCLTCINDPITGDPVNYDPEKIGNKPVPSNDVSKTVRDTSTKTETGTVVLSSPVNVDSAFAAIKPEFGFQSPEEIRRQYGTTSEWIFLSAEYGYDVNPGAYYMMRRTLNHVSDGVTYRDVVIECHIQKEGSGSKITMTWWKDGILNGKAFTDSLLRRTEKVLQR